MESAVYGEKGHGGDMALQDKMTRGEAFDVRETSIDASFPTRILVVEDESIVAKDIQTTLQTLGYSVPDVVSSGEAAIDRAAASDLDLVLMDIVLKGEMDGIEAAERIYGHFNIPVVYLTAYADDHTLQRAKTTTPFGYILKPFEERELQTAIEIALYRHKMENRLKRTEAELRHQLAIENIIANISAKFINLGTDEIDAGINQALHAVGEFAEVDRSYVFTLSDDGAVMDNSHEWCAPGIAPQMAFLQGMLLGKFTCLARKLENHEILHVPSVSAFAPDNSAEFECLKKQGIRSLIVVPMVCRSTLFGFVGFDSVRHEKTWQENDITLLKMLAEIFANTLDRKRVEEEVSCLNAELEQRVAERTMELETANRELESFSYSVSHDLRAPLRHINGFSQALLADYAEVLDEQGHDYLHRVCAASNRMGQLIDDLLELSRVSRSQMRWEPVNLSELVGNIADMLRETSPERKVTFLVAPDVVVNGDNRLLRLVMQNFLDNAWKYTSKKDAASIEFGVTESNGERAYFVSDDGVGFDMAYADKLFGAFQRLHGSSDFEGTGIGLATAQRIIRRHGGRVWGEGWVGRGATFYFTLQNPRV